MQATLRVVVLTPLILLALVSVTHAQTNAQLQAELNALVQQLAALQAQLQVTTGTPTTPTPSVGSAFGQCPNLYRPLRLGMSGSDVTALQAFLAGDSTVYPEATISGFFGALTEKAVRAFQVRYGIATNGTPDTTGYGGVGPTTRARIASVCRSGVVVTPQPIPQVPQQGVNCSLGGLTVTNGTVADFYSTSVAPNGSTCAANRQSRTCMNGVFSGNTLYQYPSCADAGSLNCRIDGENIANGVSLTAYSRRTVNPGEACASYAQARVCTNGTLTGSSNFNYLSCVVETPDSCTVNGVTIAHGSSRTFFTQETATGTNSCNSYAQTRTCTNGTLSGGSEYTKTSCTAGACVIDGATIANGSSTTAYFAQNIPRTEQCSAYAITRTCTNGALSGSSAYKYRTCTPAPTGACALDNALLLTGTAATFYSTSTAPLGASCGSYQQTRTCTNSVLSGTATYNRASCSDTAACTQGGVTVPHGDTYRFYSARTVAFDKTCTAVSQVRTCTNGKLSGTATFSYADCDVNPPTSSISDSSQYAAALVALEDLLREALMQLGF